MFSADSHLIKVHKMDVNLEYGYLENEIKPRYPFSRFEKAVFEINDFYPQNIIR